MRKLYVVIAFAVFITVGFFALDRYTRNLVDHTSRVLSLIREVENYEQSVNNEILKSAHFLYYSYDRIYRLMDQEERILADELSVHLRGYPRSARLLEKIRKEFHRKRSAVEDFETLNSVIKNSLVYIPTLSLRYVERSGEVDAEYLRLLHTVESYVLMVGRSFDVSFIEDVRAVLEQLQGKSFEDGELEELNRILIRHLSTFAEHFPEFLDRFLYITAESPMPDLLRELRETFVEEKNRKALIVTYASTGFSVLFASVLAYVAYLLISVEKHRLSLSLLNRRLREALVTDELTGLPNRLAFYKHSGKGEDACLILVNIDGFKRINDIYGSDFGDALLVGLGGFLKEWVRGQGIEGEVFRVGADDFGILTAKRSEKEITELAEKLVEDIENHTFAVKGINFNLSVSVGVACGEPLLGRADIAMKHVKRGRERIAFYSDELRERVERNLRLVITIREALAEDGVVLNFQKVVNTFTGEVHYYESLVRIRDREGNLLYPASFLDALKESRYHSRLTQAVLTKALDTFRNRDVMFSVNISADDITDRSVEGFIYRALSSESGIARRIIFEILESESIENYREIREFIERIRSLGARVAIDDFGSGYSNFSHMANLAPDFIKIGGSLIRSLPDDRTSEAVVATIVEFCGRLGIETVAEFVSSEEIYRKVRELGIPFCQGVYVGEPSDALN